jgi:hypothetical protein
MRQSDLHTRNLRYVLVCGGACVFVACCLAGLCLYLLPAGKFYSLSIFFRRRHQTRIRDLLCLLNFHTRSEVRGPCSLKSEPSGVRKASGTSYLDPVFFMLSINPRMCLCVGPVASATAIGAPYDKSEETSEPLYYQ